MSAADIFKNGSKKPLVISKSDRESGMFIPAEANKKKEVRREVTAHTRRVTRWLTTGFAAAEIFDVSWVSSGGGILRAEEVCI